MNLDQAIIESQRVTISRLSDELALLRTIGAASATMLIECQDTANRAEVENGLLRQEIDALRAKLAEAERARDNWQYDAHLRSRNETYLREQRDKAEAEVVRLREALLRVEWCADPENGIEKCHWCGGERWVGARSGQLVGGHEADCPHQLALDAARTALDAEGQGGDRDAQA